MSEKKSPGSPYDVGYKKPPTATQFKKGESGNPKGRPKGSRNFGTIVDRVFSRKLEALDNGRSRRVQAAEVMLTKILSKAIGGDASAQRISIGLLTMPKGDTGPAPTLFQSDADRELLRAAFADNDVVAKSETPKPKRARSRKGGQ